MPMWKDESGGPRMLSTEEFDAVKRAEREQLEQPAREQALRARLMFRGRPSFVVEADASQDAGSEAMSLLAEAFHVLREAPGVRPWDVDALYEHALSAAATSATRHVVRFLLDVWNNQVIDVLDEGGEHTLGHFDCIAALASWDAGNRAAFATWVADPWWP